MGKFSQIAWTDHTFNAWIGCQKVSPGCQFCYAENETFVRKERSHGNELWGPAGFRHVTSRDYWMQPIKWNGEAWIRCSTCGWRGNGVGVAALNGCPQCGAKTGLFPTRQRVFCMSLGDIFEGRRELLPIRTRLYELIEATPNLDWLLLTKRIDGAGSMLPSEWLRGPWPTNVWMGTSVENQEWANERIPELMKLPAPIKFVSAEPLLGPIDFRIEAALAPQWIIVGGESGRKCRPFKAEWAESILEQCWSVTPHIAFFMKQLGGYPDKRDNIAEFKRSLQIREWPR